MLWKKYISQSPRTSPPINIISYFRVSTSLQSNWRTPYSSSHSFDSQMLYGYSAVRPTANLKLFRTNLLNYLSEFSCWYLDVVKGKGTEAIPSTRMNHFNITPLHHYTILTFHHFTVSPFGSHYHLCNIVLLAISPTSLKQIHIIYLIFILQREPLSFLGPSPLLNIRSHPLISTI